MFNIGSFSTFSSTVPLSILKEKKNVSFPGLSVCLYNLYILKKLYNDFLANYFSRDNVHMHNVNIHTYQINEHMSMSVPIR